MRTTIQIKKQADGLAIHPEWAKFWKAIKAECGTTQRGPRYVTITTEPSAAMPDDHDCCRRFAVDLDTLEVLGAIHVSAGEWACGGNARGQDLAVDGVPEGKAMVTATWNDYFRYFHLDIQVNASNMPKAINAQGCEHLSATPALS
jgi:hypothetical protein